MENGIGIFNQRFSSGTKIHQSRIIPIKSDSIFGKIVHITQANGFGNLIIQEIFFFNITIFQQRCTEKWIPKSHTIRLIFQKIITRMKTVNFVNSTDQNKNLP